MAGFLFKYEPSEYPRVIPAVLIDDRANIPAIANQTGAVIKAYFDVEVDKIKNNPRDVLFYRIETINAKGQIADGVLAGYFSLLIKGQMPTAAASLYQFQLRPPFKQNTTGLSAEIAIFIQANIWKRDLL